MLRFMNEKGATTAGPQTRANLILTVRGTPQIFYGDEIAIPGGGDPDNRRDFPGGFAGDARNAFERNGRTPEQQDVFEHVRRLIRIRAELEPLRRGAQVNLYAAPQQYAYARVSERASVIIAINNEDKPATIEFGIAPANLTSDARLFDRLDTIREARVDDGRLKLNLPARSASILTNAPAR
jgi:glycosidase